MAGLTITIGVVTAHSDGITVPVTFSNGRQENFSYPLGTDDNAIRTDIKDRLDKIVNLSAKYVALNGATIS